MEAVPTELLENIRSYAENMTWHAEQVASRSVARNYQPAYDKYVLLMEYLQKSSQSLPSESESTHLLNQDKQDFGKKKKIYNLIALLLDTHQQCKSHNEIYEERYKILNKNTNTHPSEDFFGEEQKSSKATEEVQPTKNEEDIGKDEPMFKILVIDKETGLEDNNLIYHRDGKLATYESTYSDSNGLQVKQIITDQSRYQVKLQLSDKILDDMTKELTERICRYDSGGLIKEIINKHLSGN